MQRIVKLLQQQFSVSLHAKLSYNSHYSEHRGLLLFGGDGVTFHCFFFVGSRLTTHDGPKLAGKTKLSEIVSTCQHEYI